MRLGVVGTLVWDSIIPHGGDCTIQEWGGIAYSLAALDTTLDSTCTVFPIVKVGNDLSGPALDYFDTLQSVDASGVTMDARPNNRVELAYHDAHERIEVLSGGVSPWSSEELRDRVEDCDALYINFISGFEMSLDTARALRAGFSGPIYADLHSLFLGIDIQGRRFPKAPDAAVEWFGLFDCVQMNRLEASLLEGAGGSMDGPGPVATFVTDGPAGVDYTCVEALLDSPVNWPKRGAEVLCRRGGHVASNPAAVRVDPTGCGDVWGAACFASLLTGVNVPASVRSANHLAEVALGVRGATQVQTALASLGQKGDAAS